MAGKMIKLSKFVVVFLCVCAFLTVSQKAKATPALNLWMTGELNGSDLTVQVHRENTEFGLGGLFYNLQFSEILESTREYNDYGSIANDGVWDSSRRSMKSCLLSELRRP